MRYHFYKMQGTGNDYVYMSGFEQPVGNPSALSVKVSDRHFGIGSDGLILLLPSQVADVRMQMFNADGSEGRMCGNGIRCVGRLAYESGICRRQRMTVETLSGIKTLELTLEGGVPTGASVDMGAPGLDPAKIPVKLGGGRVVAEPVEVACGTYRITCVSMGNPHAVIFTSGIDALELPVLGPKFEKNPLFPESVNTEFVEVLGPNELRMRVWERGSGETLACGTGACATVVAACLNGHCRRGDDATVHLRGGDLVIRWEESRVLMQGPAELVFTGDIEA